MLTVAIAEALMTYNTFDKIEFKEKLIDTFHKYGELYPDVGYGGHYLKWVEEKSRIPYNSCGNGSAMRTSAVGWFSKSLEECEELAKVCAEVTHNHPDGIAGAQATSGIIFLARNGAAKDELKSYMEKFYSINFTIDEIRPFYEYEILNKTTVPQAFQCFYESSDFEDAIRTAISIGGDSDTVAAIAGSMAEAFYGISDEISETGLSFLDEYLSEIVSTFYDAYIK